MVRTSLVRGIAVLLAAATVSTSAPAMTMPANDTEMNIVEETSEEEVNDAAEEEAVISEESAEDPAEDPTAEPETDPAEDPTVEPETDPAEDPTVEPETDPAEEAAVEALPISVSGEDKPAADGSKDKDHPVYTENVTIENGTLSDDFSEADISFSGVFAGSEITGLNVKEDRTGFTLTFTKAYESAETDFEGGMLLNAAAVLDTNGETSLDDFSIYLYDTYRVKQEEEKKSFDLTDKDIEDLLKKLADAGLEKAMNTLFSSFMGEDLGKALTAWLQEKGISFKDAAAVDSASAEMKALQNLSTQLDQATLDILQGIDFASLKNSALNIDKAANAVKQDSDTYISGMKDVQEMTEEGTLEDNEQAVDNTMKTIYRFGNGNPNIYSPEMANFTCYNDLINLGNVLLGNGLFGDNDAFQIYHGIASHRYNYNTQSFASRRAYNEMIMKFYDQAYAAMKTAIDYDIHKNQALQEEYQSEMDELNQALEQNISSKAKKMINDRIKTLKAALKNAGNAVSEGGRRIENLDKQWNALDAARTGSDAEITAEEGQPYVLCYRNNVKYNKELTAAETKDFAVNGKFAESDVNNFIKLYQNAMGAGYVSAVDSGWYIKDEWKNGKKDGDCSWDSAFKKSIVFKGNQASNLEYLNKIAKERKLTLAEDLGTAFSYQNASAASALENGSVKGFYKGGDFTVGKAKDGNYYCYERTTFLWCTKATNEDYDWIKFQHNTNYYDANGKVQTNTDSRDFSLTHKTSFSGSNSNVPSVKQLYRGAAYTGQSANLFLVNFYEEA